MNDPLAQLAAANPVPDESLTPEQKERADALLERLTQPAQKKRRPFLVAAAAVAVLALGVAVIPGLSNNATPQATAEEVLARAGEASASQADAPTLGQEYMKRTDSDGQATVTTEYEVHAGQLRQDTRTEGTSAALADFDPSPRITLAQLADAPSADALRDLAVATYGDAALGSLQLLLHPGLTSAQQKLVYDNLAAAGGNELGSADITAGQDSLVTVYRDADHVSFSVLPSTGQIVEVHGLVAPDVTTRVEATAILGCVAATGLEGPELISLACADNNYLVRDLQWSNWGADSARAEGTAFINDCDPNCAESGFTQLPVTVTVRERQECGYNAKLYSKLDVAYADEPARNETFDIGCDYELMN